MAVRSVTLSSANRSVTLDRPISLASTLETAIDNAPEQPAVQGAIKIPFFERDYHAAPQLEKIMIELIQEFPELRHLKDFEITVLWKREGGKAQGVPKMASAAAAAGLSKWYSASDFIIWVAADHTSEAKYTPHAFRALLYHELRHCGVRVNDQTDETSPAIVPHEFEGFFDEIDRFGIWRSELGSLKTRFTQERLWEGDENTFRGRM